MKKILTTTIEQVLKNSKENFKDLEDFSEQVLIDYILTMSKKSIIIDYTKLKDTKEELLEEIKEITKKKMYGFYDINEYRLHLTKTDC